MSKRKASGKGPEGGGQDLTTASGFPHTVTTPVFLCFLGTLGTTLSYRGPEHFLRGAVPPCGPDWWPVAFTFSVCKARLSAEWQRHTLWSQTSLIPITALPSRSLALVFFCLCGVKLIQLLPSSRISGLWGWTDLDSRLCYLLTLEVF